MPDSTAAQFFTWGSLGTLAGATSATMVITNTLRSAIGWEAKWIGLAIAEVICLGAAFATGSTGSDFESFWVRFDPLLADWNRLGGV